MTTRKYRIDRVWQETECPLCRWPADVGDTAWVLEDKGVAVETGFCSQGCARTFWEIKLIEEEVEA